MNRACAHCGTADCIVLITGAVLQPVWLKQLHNMKVGVPQARTFSARKYFQDAPHTMLLTALQNRQKPCPQHLKTVYINWQYAFCLTAHHVQISNLKSTIMPVTNFFAHAAAINFEG